ncbi:MAG: fumarylacetoacetate hydrolase, partial [Pseudomonas qingdaonensis]
MTNHNQAHAPLALSNDLAVFATGSWVGRVWLPEQGPAVVLVRAGAVH